MKYLVYECQSSCGGWADRLKGIISVFALSLLTNRQFIINITNPCNFSQLFVPNEVNWDPSPIVLQGNATTTRITCMTAANIECIELFTLKKSKLLDESGVLIIRTNRDFIHFPYENKDLREKILNLGFSPNNFTSEYLFHEWYNKLFKLEPNLLEKYTSFKKSQTNSVVLLFCAQIRIGGSRPHVSYDSKFNHRNVTIEFWRFIKEKFVRNATLHNQNWKLFVTSDLEDVEMEAVDEFGSGRVIRLPGLNTHVDREKNLGNNCSRVEKPILDFHFLQNCDKAVVSRGGWGKYALMKSQTKQVFVIGNGQRYPNPNPDPNISLSTVYIGGCVKGGNSFNIKLLKDNLQNMASYFKSYSIILYGDNDVRMNFSSIMSDMNINFMPFK